MRFVAVRKTDFVLPNVSYMKERCRKALVDVADVSQTLFVCRLHNNPENQSSQQTCPNVSDKFDNDDFSKTQLAWTRGWEPLY